MEAWADGGNAERMPGNYKKTKSQVVHASTLRIHVAPGRGWAARLHPQWRRLQSAPVWSAAACLPQAGSIPLCPLFEQSVNVAGALSRPRCTQGGGDALCPR